MYKSTFGKAKIIVMGIGLAVLIAMVSVGGFAQTTVNSVPPPDNLILFNSSFEVDADANGFADKWVEYINIGSASLSGTEVFEGNYSQRLVSDLQSNLTGAGRILYLGGSMPNGTIPVVQNQPYTFAYWFKAEAGTSAIANIKGYNAAGGEQSPQTSVDVVATGEWQRIFVSMTFTNALQVSATVLPGLSSGPAGRVIYIDSAAFAPDDDRDGVFNTQDNCTQLANPGQQDQDLDGIGDGCDSTPNGDSDNDGVDNLADNCPTVANPDQSDTDADGIGNACDSTPNGDTDGDGIDNAVDNCPLTSNVNQADADQDGIGDVCDSDDDNDGVLDNCDVDSNPGATDFDRDGIVDGSGCDTQIGPPVDKDQCKNGGWQLFNVPRRFNNQGDCIQFVNTGM